MKTVKIDAQRSSKPSILKKRWRGDFGFFYSLQVEKKRLEFRYIFFLGDIKDVSWKKIPQHSMINHLAVIGLQSWNTEGTEFAVTP